MWSICQWVPQCWERCGLLEKLSSQESHTGRSVFWWQVMPFIQSVDVQITNHKFLFRNISTQTTKFVWFIILCFCFPFFFPFAQRNPKMENLQNRVGFECTLLRPNMVFGVFKWFFCRKRSPVKSFFVDQQKAQIFQIFPCALRSWFDYLESCFPNKVALLK